MSVIKEYTSKVFNWLLFAFIMFGSSVYVNFCVFILEKIGLKITNSTTKSLVSIPIYISFMIIIYLIFRRSFNENIKRYGKDFKKYFFWSLKFYLIGIGIMMISNIVIYFVLRSNSVNEILVQEYLSKYPVFMAFSSIIYSPFVEEVAFRKIIRNIFDNKYVYILVSGFLFGFVHCIAGLSNTLELLYIIPYGTMGVIFAYIYYKTDNIFIPITLHMIHNLFIFILSVC